MTTIDPSQRLHATVCLRWFATGAEDACLFHRFDAANGGMPRSQAAVRLPMQPAISKLDALIGASFAPSSRCAGILNTTGAEQSP